MSPRGFALAAALGCAGFACGGSDGVEPPPPPPPPPAGPAAINFDVTTDLSLEHGGLLLAVVGGAVDSVTGLAGYEVFHASSATGARAIVFGAIVNGPLMRVWVPDASRAAQYGVTVTEGAVRGSYAVLPGTIYQVSRRP